MYEEEKKLLGYSIIVDQHEKKNLYAWYGGVLPEFQGNGITAAFLEYIIAIARAINYSSVTLASSNLRPHMLRLAIKMGFDIYDLKKRDYGEGNKIYFRYSVLPMHLEKIPLSENNRKLKPVEIETRLVKAYKSSASTIEFCYDENIDTLIYAINYCNSFSKKPNLIINTESASIPVDDKELQKAIKAYNGKI